MKLRLHGKLEFQSLIGIQGNLNSTYQGHPFLLVMFQSLIGIQGNLNMETLVNSVASCIVSIPNRYSGEFKLKPVCRIRQSSLFQSLIGIQGNLNNCK